ncbi:MAG: hypothetical protein GX606_05485 [Elusimicrobia bacterium]|mgnify:CR=1 FL=1|nr:hypothetical protein [Elusimicrobiota bacterium]
MAFGDRKPQKEESSSPKTIEINAEMNGSLTFKDPVDLKINGLFTGSLDVRGTLTVGTRAQVEANINGDNVIISGRVKGNVSVSKLLTLLPTAVLHGDIHAPKLNIVEGAVFQGVCHMSVQETGEWMDVPALSRYLEIDEKAIWDLVNSGKIPVVREGDALKFERVQIDNWAASGMVH